MKEIRYEIRKELKHESRRVKIRLSMISVFLELITMKLDISLKNDALEDADVKIMKRIDALEQNVDLKNRVDKRLSTACISDGNLSIRTYI